MTPNQLIQFHASLASAAGILEAPGHHQYLLTGCLIGGLLSTAFDPPKTPRGYKDFAMKWVLGSCAGYLFAPYLLSYLNLNSLEATLFYSGAVSMAFWWSVPLLKGIAKLWAKRQGTQE